MFRAGLKPTMAPEYKSAIDAHTIIKSMTYEMVLLSFGDPEQKKVEDSTDVIVP